jgi:hypothetical protein
VSDPAADDYVEISRYLYDVADPTVPDIATQRLVAAVRPDGGLTLDKLLEDDSAPSSARTRLRESSTSKTILVHTISSPSVLARRGIGGSKRKFTHISWRSGGTSL